jgi:transposase-like protein
MPNVIILCVRWYLRFKPSLRDLVEMMAERGWSLAHTTIMLWVQQCTPAFEKRWQRHALSVSRSWRVDETFVKIGGTGVIGTAPWTCRAGQSTSGWAPGVMSLPRKPFSQGKQEPPTVAANDHAVREPKSDGLLPKDTKLRSSKYLNNLIEQDHRGSSSARKEG